MAYKYESKNQKTEAARPAYNTKLHISQIEFTRKGEKTPTRLPYITILDSFAYPKEGKKTGKKYFRIPVTGEYSLARLHEVYGVKDDEDTAWITVFLPSDKCGIPNSEKCKLSVCGTLYYSPENGYTISADLYSTQV